MQRGPKRCLIWQTVEHGVARGRGNMQADKADGSDTFLAVVRVVDSNGMLGRPWAPSDAITPIGIAILCGDFYGRVAR